MEELLLNKTFTLPVYDGFHVMDEAERKEMTFLEEGPCVCLSDPAKHMIVTIGWKEIGGLASLLVNVKEIAAKAELAVSKAMAGFGYRSEGFLAREIAGRSAEGFGYAYEAEETAMIGQTYAAKAGKTVYYFNLYARESLKEESLRVWEDLLDSVKPA